MKNYIKVIALGLLSVVISTQAFAAGSPKQEVALKCQVVKTNAVKQALEAAGRAALLETCGSKCHALGVQASLVMPKAEASNVAYAEMLPKESMLIVDPSTSTPEAQASDGDAAKPSKAVTLAQHVRVNAVPCEIKDVPVKIITSYKRKGLKEPAQLVSEGSITLAGFRG